MRQTISALVAAIAVMAGSAAPAQACYAGACAPPPVYVAPVAAYGYWGCGYDCGWPHQRLPDPELQYGDWGHPRLQQYYYVNQGPTFTGPGNFAPSPTYREGRVIYTHHAHRPVHHWRHYGRHALRRYY